MKWWPFHCRAARSLVFWLYEYAMIAELVVYGPVYFWMLTLNLVQVPVFVPPQPSGVMIRYLLLYY